LKADTAQAAGFELAVKLFWMGVKLTQPSDQVAQVYALLASKIPGGS
jgi:hypothetical protein